MFDNRQESAEIVDHHIDAKLPVFGKFFSVLVSQNFFRASKTPSKLCRLVARFSFPRILQLSAGKSHTSQMPKPVLAREGSRFC
jgi:hypothetical protein